MALLFGGNNRERGISITSTRAIYELLHWYVDFTLYYFDKNNKIYNIHVDFLYSNTIEDFDHLMTQPIAFEEMKADFYIPLIHGEYGEGGQLMFDLEKRNMPHMFSKASSCSKSFYKKRSKDILISNGFHGWLSYVFDEDYEKLSQLLKERGKLILKPNNDGSSFGVHLIHNMEEATRILSQNENYLVEEVHQGVEFSILVINGIAQLPILIHKQRENTIFSYHDKYFPTEEIRIESPGNLPIDLVTKIQMDSTKIYNIFEAKHVMRIDGWILNNGHIIYTDLNPIPSFEHNGLFWQSIFELDRSAYLIKLINLALDEYNLPPIIHQDLVKPKLRMIFGGNSSERNVSLLSAASVAIKLQYQYNIVPYYWKNNEIYTLPTYLLFRHTLKDINYFIENFEQIEKRLSSSNRGLEKLSMEEFLDNSQEIFLALHGGDGENGLLQSWLEERNIRFNGENSVTSKLCMDKYETSRVIREIEEPYLYHRLVYCLSYPYDSIPNIKYPLIIKPRSDGCSTGVVKICNKEELLRYLDAMRNQDPYVMIHQQHITLPEIKKMDILLEEYMEVDKITCENKNVIIHDKTGWIELTIGYLKQEVFLPSLTIGENNILSAEEKFQSGTGINITPAPIHWQHIIHIQNIVKKVLQKLQLKEYGRIDLFFNRYTLQVSIIEVNTLPALTFSTVIYSQALRHNMKPHQFLTKIFS